MVTNCDMVNCDKEFVIFIKFTLEALRVGAEKLNNKKVLDSGLTPSEMQ